MATTIQSVVWRCATCKVCGVADLDDKSSILSIIASINADHALKSPECETGDKEIHILNEKAA